MAKRHYDKAHGRDYTYDKAYQASPEQKKNRAARNKARRSLMRRGMVRKGDGKDVDHKTPLDRGGSNDPKNWRVQPASVNRGFKRDGRNNPL